MKINGEHIFNGPRKEVWELFFDPIVLANALPGTQKFEQVGDDEFEGVMNIRIGPVSGVFSGKIARSDLVPPERCTLSLDGKGTPGFVKGVGNIELIDQGDATTMMKYDGEIQIGGTLASVGQRMIDSVSKSMIRTGFESLDKTLEARLKANAEGVEADYEAPTESEFAKSVVKDMAGGMLASKRTRLYLYTISAVILLILLLFIISQCQP